MKQRISRGGLEALVLAAIQAEPGCSGVQEISVTAVSIVSGDPTWHVTVISEGSVPFDVANHAAKRVQDRLHAQYELAP